jgi:hypothetical protein
MNIDVDTATSVAIAFLQVLLPLLALLLLPRIVPAG